MPTLIIGGAHIRMIDLRRNAEGTILTRVDFTSDLTDALADRLGCSDAKAAVSIKRADLLRGDIPIAEFSLRATGIPRELEVVATRISDFRLIHSQKDEDSPVVTELQFQIWGPGAIVELVRDYWEVIGEGKGQLRAKTIEQARVDEDADPDSESDEPTQTTFDGREEAPDKPKRKRTRKPKVSSAEASATVQ